jgi:ATP-binding cassette, subfamily B, multidrug efflux pump
MPEYRHEEEIVGKALDKKLVKRMFTYLKPYKWRVIFGIALLLAWNAMYVVIPYLAKIAVDNYIQNYDFYGLTWISLAILGMVLVRSVVTYIESLILLDTGQFVLRDMRNDIFKKLQSLPMSFYDKNPVGRLMTRVTSDVDAINGFLVDGIPQLLAGGFISIGTIVMLFLIDYRLAFIAIAIVPFITATTWIFAHFAQKFYREIRVKMAKVNAFLQESISGVMAIQIANRQEVNQGMFKNTSGELLTSQTNAVLNFSIFFQVTDLFTTVAIGLVVWYGSLMILSKSIMVGTVMVFVHYVRELYQSVHELSNKFNILQSAMASSERIFKLLDEPVTITEKENAEVFPGRAKGKVQLDNVFFSYNPGTLVLKGVNFTAEPGQKIAIVGPTGAGKSSIISLLSRLYDIQKGDIRIDNQSIYDLTLNSLRHQIAVVLQHPFIFSGPLIENITLLSGITREQAKQSARIVGAEDFILKLPDGYDTILTERGSTLSVGQRQLLSFARAIAHDPSILVLDEATSSIDTASEELIQTAMQKMMVGRTSIVIAHRLSTIKDADQVLVINKGKIIEHGKHDDLLARDGVYKRLYELQFKSQEK